MTNLSHSLTAAICAILVSTTFIAAAVAPGAAIQAAPVATAQLATSAQAHA